MLKEIIKSFLPWILFFVLADYTQQIDIAIIVAAITSIVLEYKGLRKGFILSWGTLIFFIFMFIAVVILNNQWISKHSWIFSNGTLALIVWASILIRKPFTIQYAKEQVSEDKWNHPIFITVNYLLTAVWGLIFLIGITIQLIKIYNPQLNGLTYEIITYLPSIFGIWFTTWFPDWYKEKSRVNL